MTSLKLAEGLVARKKARLFWGAQADQAVDGVRSAVATGVVVADLEFAEQTDGEHLDAGYDENCGYYEERAVLVHHVLVRVDELGDEQEEREEAAGDDA